MSFVLDDVSNLSEVQEGGPKWGDWVPHKELGDSKKPQLESRSILLHVSIRYTIKIALFDLLWYYLPFM